MIHLSWYQYFGILLGCSMISLRMGQLTSYYYYYYYEQPWIEQHSSVDGGGVLHHTPMDDDISILYNDSIIMYPMDYWDDDDTIVNGSRCMDHHHHHHPSHYHSSLLSSTVPSIHKQSWENDDPIYANNNNNTFIPYPSIEEVIQREHLMQRVNDVLFMSSTSKRRKRKSNTQEQQELSKSIHDERTMDYYYYEVMVHPALILHPYPVYRVMILYDVTGRILHEVLKHASSIQEIIYVIPNNNNTTSVVFNQNEWKQHPCYPFIVPSHCIQDPNVSIRYKMTDAVNNMEWLQDVPTNSTDVVFVETNRYLDITDHKFLSNIYNILGDCGMVVTPFDTIETWYDVPLSYIPKDYIQQIHKNPLYFIQQLNDTRFTNVVSYIDFDTKFIIAMKCSQCRSNWQWNEAEWNIRILQRMTSSNDDSSHTIGSSSTLQYLDGATMMTYQYATRIMEEIWCRNVMSDECISGHGFDPYKLDIPISSLEVKLSSIGHGGRGVFTTENIPIYSSIGLEQCVHGFFIPSTVIQLFHVMQSIETIMDLSEFWNVIHDGFLDGYGWNTKNYGGLPVGGVDTGIMTFVNHGCNGTSNIEPKFSWNEMNVTYTDVQVDCIGTASIYDPYAERHFPMQNCQDLMSNRELLMGEELFSNYVCYSVSTYKYWEENINELISMCNGKSGFISEYELIHKKV